MEVPPRVYLHKISQSLSIREPGKIKGVRLFHLASILAFIERCENEANAAHDEIGILKHQA